MSVDKILEERPTKHGEFEENSRATWLIMDVIQGERNWPTLTHGQRHALYMIAHKMARIASGDPAFQDHWDDIAGYAMLVSRRIITPVVPYDREDVYAALAVGWGVTREQAKEKVTAGRMAAAVARTGAPAPAVAAPMPRANYPVRPEPTRPGTPEDGGHYAKQMEDEIAKELSKDLDDKKVPSGPTGSIPTQK